MELNIILAVHADAVQVVSNTPETVKALVSSLTQNAPPDSDQPWEDMICHSSPELQTAYVHITGKQPCHVWFPTNMYRHQRFTCLSRLMEALSAIEAEKGATQ